MKLSFVIFSCCGVVVEVTREVAEPREVEVVGALLGVRTLDGPSVGNAELNQ